jgi:hypothetical protein
MANRMTKCALAAGLAGAFAMIATTGSLAAPKAKYPKDSYEAWGARPDAPPVPGFALQGLQAGSVLESDQRQCAVRPLRALLGMA